MTSKSPTTPTTSAALVAAAQQGDEHAWETLFDLHYTRVYRFFRARLSTSEQAEDLASATFMEAFRSIGSFRWQGKPFEAWFFGIAHHQLASYYRSRPQAPLQAEGTVRDEFLDVEIRDILDALPPDYRTALELRFIVGLSGVEAAEVMGRSHGAFRSLLLRAVRAFRDESQQDDRPAQTIQRRTVTAAGRGAPIGGSAALR